MSAVKGLCPPEFVIMCEQDGVTPEQVLKDFIADLCGLPTSGGSGERDLAEAWYHKRGYPYRNRDR